MESATKLAKRFIAGVTRPVCAPEDAANPHHHNGPLSPPLTRTNLLPWRDHPPFASLRLLR
jgi:hypothetical protein